MTVGVNVYETTRARLGITAIVQRVHGRSRVEGGKSEPIELVTSRVQHSYDIVILIIVHTHARMHAFKSSRGSDRRRTAE